MYSDTTVSVLVPSYNRASYLGEALDSILRQRHPAQEIVVVDDGSTDESRAILIHYARWVQPLFRSHRGLAVTLREGFALCKGDYIHVCDPDDVLEPDALEVLAGLLDAHPRAGVAYGNISRINSEGQALGVSRYPRPLGCHREVVRLVLGNYIPNPATMFRRAALPSARRALPSIDEAQDWERWIRMGLDGWAYVGVDQVLARYRQHALNMTGDANFNRCRLAEISMLENIRTDYSDLDVVVARAVDESIHRRYLELAWRALEEGRCQEARQWFRHTPMQWTLPDVGGRIAATLPFAYAAWQQARAPRRKRVADTVGGR